MMKMEKMNKKGSIWTLLVVALVALALMTFVSFNSDVTGAFGPGPRGPRMGPGPGPGPKPPIVRTVDRDVTVVQEGTPDYVVTQPVETTSNYDDIRLSCYIFGYEHPGQATPDIKRICSAYGVAV